MELKYETSMERFEALYLDTGHVAVIIVRKA
jgi:hypothetical protein